MGFFVFPARNLILESHYGIRFRGCSHKPLVAVDLVSDKVTAGVSVDDGDIGLMDAKVITGAVVSATVICMAVEQSETIPLSLASRLVIMNV